MLKNPHPISAIVSSLYDVSLQLQTLQKKRDINKNEQSDMVAINKLAKRMLLKQLHLRAPRIPISCKGDRDILLAHRVEKAFFLVSPMDGSKNWTRGLPMWGISVAYVDYQTITCGATFSGNFNLLRATISDTEVYSIDLRHTGLYNVQGMRVSSQDRFSQAFIAVNWERETSDIMDWLMQVSDLYTDWTHFFDSTIYAFALLVEGKIDGFVHLNPCIQDIAASLLLVEKSGGIVTDIVGNPYDLFSRQPIVATNGKIHKALLEKLLEIGILPRG